MMQPESEKKTGMNMKVLKSIKKDSLAKVPA